MTTSRIFRVTGPPGTGKTTYLAKQAVLAADKHGPSSVVAVSLTRTAASEIAGRDTGIPDELVGTLHAHAYRALDRPELAETAPSLREFSDAFPAWELHKGGSGETLEDTPDGYADYAAQTPGQRLHCAVTNHRARTTPPSQWTQEERLYANCWEDFKTQTGRLDFTDLIQRATTDAPTHPANPAVLLLDEAQDFSALELALAVQWSKTTQTTVIVGDTDQALYQWRGSDPHVLDNLPVAGQRVLDQSHRVPGAVHAAAAAWIGQLSDRPDVHWSPTSEPGHFALADYDLRATGHLTDALRQTTAEGRSTMLLTTCSYMLTPVLHALRDAGVPFHNPYRCSPADEPILTPNGWVPIGELDPKVHRLAGYYGANNTLSWGGRSGPHRSSRDRGFGFEVGSRPYSGPLLTLTTDVSRTRVTPNHRLRVRFAETFRDKWIVYLMRRGAQWRIGRSNTRGGLGSRLTTEGGDGAWILSVHDSKLGASFEEMRMQAEYGITGATFRAWRHPERQADLDALHESLAPQSGERARLLLSEFGLLEEHPLYRLLRCNDGVRLRVSARSLDGFETVAANVLPGYMALPVPPGEFLDPTCSRTCPEWRTVTVAREHFEGVVYSLDVPGPEHYISGGAVVHNSKNGAWNPLRSARRLLAFLRPQTATWGPHARAWTWGDLHAWIEPLQARGTLARGAKSSIEEAVRVDRFGESREDAEVPLDVLCELLGDPGTLTHPAMRLDVDWWAEHLLASKKAAMDYPLQILRRRGGAALRETPKLIAGTVHSVKGGEADHVILSPNLSKQGYWHGWHEGGAGREAIVRMIYVGLTRAREQVTVLRASTPERVPLDVLRECEGVGA